jgi:Flp pilus assembly protein TadD
MERARIALEESVDLEQASPTKLSSVLAGHSTPLLRQASSERLSVAVAAQHYRALARIEWVTAAGGHPWGADLLYALGRTYDRQAEQEPARQRSLHQQSLVCYEAAAQIAPTRHFVTCQLGTSLLKMERTSEALEAFRASLTSAPTAEAWNGLAESYRRLGDIPNADAARQQAMALAERKKSYSPAQPEIVQVTPEEFARFSPSHVLPHPRESLHREPDSASERARVANQPSADRSSPSATSVGSRWLPSIFR